MVNYISKTNLSYVIYNIVIDDKYYQILYNEDIDIAYAVFRVYRDKKHNIKKVTEVKNSTEFLNIMHEFREAKNSAEVISVF